CGRAAAVLGFIAAGGIGYEINVSMRLFEYGQVLTLIATLVLLVVATEAAGRFIRRRLHANAPAGSLAHQHLEDGSTPRPQGRIETELRKHAGTIIALLVVIGSFYLIGFFNGSLADSTLWARSARFVAKMFPLDLDRT